MYDKQICLDAELLNTLEYVWLNFTIFKSLKIDNVIFIGKNAHCDTIGKFSLIIFYHSVKIEYYNFIFF